MTNEMTTTNTPQEANWLTPGNFGAVKQLAELMAAAKLVPEHLRNSPGDCLLVIAQASSWKMNPISVAQATAVVRGKLCYEGKLVSAVLTSLGAIEGRLSYEFSGTGQGMTVIVTGTPRGGKTVSLTGSVKQWRTDNKMWDSDPQSMLAYRGTRQWARLFAPEAMLGVMTPDEDREDLSVGAIPATAVRVTVEPQTQASQPEQEQQQPAQEQPKKPAAKKNGNGMHPAIAKAKELFDALPGEHRALVLSRLNAIFGARNAKDIPAEQLDNYSTMAGQLLAIHADLGMDGVLDNLEQMEASAKSDTYGAEE